MKDGNELNNALSQFTGGDQPFHHSLVKSFFYTAGVRHFALNAGQGAYWMLDIIATEPKIRLHMLTQGFALVEIKVEPLEAGRAYSSASLIVRNDTGTEPVFSLSLDFTDCPVAPTSKYNPEGVWKFYLESTQVGSTEGFMLMLPQER